MSLANTSDSPYAVNALKRLTIHNINLKYTLNKLNLGKFNILYFNINSILNKLDDLEIEIERILHDNNGNHIHIIALTEIRLHEHLTKYFNFRNYKSYFVTRHDGYGGCAIFVHDCVSSALNEKKSANNVEILAVNLIGMNLTVAVVYKQPVVNNDIFIGQLESFIENKKNLIVVCDMNLNLLDDSPSIKRYTDTLIANGFAILNHIHHSFATRSATRMSNGYISSSNTVIDHIITDCFNHSFELSQIDTSISDHNTLMLSFDNNNLAFFFRKLILSYIPK